MLSRLPHATGAWHRKGLPASSQLSTDPQGCSRVSILSCNRTLTIFVIPCLGCSVLQVCHQGHSCQEIGFPLSLTLPDPPSVPVLRPVRGMSVAGVPRLLPCWPHPFPQGWPHPFPRQPRLLVSQGCHSHWITGLGWLGVRAGTSCHQGVVWQRRVANLAS